MGADVLYPCARPFVIQFKAAKSGVDNSAVTFQINNNKWKNQHRALDVITNSGLCEAYCAFPLVVSDGFLTRNFGSLLGFTIMVDARRITGTLNWVNKVHLVEVQRSGQFTVTSNEVVTGIGFLAKDFFKKKAKEIGNLNKEKVAMSDYIRNLIESMEYSVKKAGIVGQSEHTITLIGTDIDKKHLEYLQLPVRIRGLGKDSEEKPTFQKTP